ncbi:MAG: aminotransferase class IV [Elusimicrobiota bacterium]|jgi:D-alanine transaminase|nr:aminotransferase class IV [Elusimicrobiota bacterium]
MNNLGYYNGQIGLIEDIRIPMEDRACWFGDGVYDASVCANFTIFMLKEHIDRFYKSAELIQIKLPFSKQELEDLLKSLVKKLDSPYQTVFWQATRSTQPRSHAFDENLKPNLWIMIRPEVRKDFYKKLRLITVEDTRYFHCNIKTLNLLPNVLAKQKAVKEGCDEAVFCRNNIVTECAHSNIHIIKEGIFKTAPTGNLILAGIARANLIKYCRILNIPVQGVHFTIDEMMNADEVIISSSSAFAMSISHINNKPIPSKAPDILAALQKAAIKDFQNYTGFIF